MYPPPQIRVFTPCEPKFQGIRNNKKEGAETLLMQNAHSNTPKAQVGQPSEVGQAKVNSLKTRGSSPHSN